MLFKKGNENEKTPQEKLKVKYGVTKESNGIFSVKYPEKPLKDIKKAELATAFKCKEEEIATRLKNVCTDTLYIYIPDAEKRQRLAESTSKPHIQEQLSYDEDPRVIVALLKNPKLVIDPTKSVLTSARLRIDQQEQCKELTNIPALTAVALIKNGFPEDYTTTTTTAKADFYKDQRENDNISTEFISELCIEESEENFNNDYLNIFISSNLKTSATDLDELCENILEELEAKENAGIAADLRSRSNYTVILNIAQNQNASPKTIGKLYQKRLKENPVPNDVYRDVFIKNHNTETEILLEIYEKNQERLSAENKLDFILNPNFPLEKRIQILQSFFQRNSDELSTEEFTKLRDAVVKLGSDSSAPKELVRIVFENVDAVNFYAEKSKTSEKPELEKIIIVNNPNLMLDINGEVEYLTPDETDENKFSFEPFTEFKIEDKQQILDTAIEIAKNKNTTEIKFLALIDQFQDQKEPINYARTPQFEVLKEIAENSNITLKVFEKLVEIINPIDKIGENGFLQNGPSNIDNNTAFKLSLALASNEGLQKLKSDKISSFLDLFFSELDEISTRKGGPQLLRDFTAITSNEKLKAFSKIVESLNCSSELMEKIVDYGKKLSGFGNSYDVHIMHVIVDNPSSAISILRKIYNDPILKRAIMETITEDIETTFKVKTTPETPWEILIQILKNPHSEDEYIYNRKLAFFENPENNQIISQFGITEQNYEQNIGIEKHLETFLEFVKSVDSKIKPTEIDVYNPNAETLSSVLNVENSESLLSILSQIQQFFIEKEKDLGVLQRKLSSISSIFNKNQEILEFFAKADIYLTKEGSLRIKNNYPTFAQEKLDPLSGIKIEGDFLEIQIKDKSFTEILDQLKDFRNLIRNLYLEVAKSYKEEQKVIQEQLEKQTINDILNELELEIKQNKIITDEKRKELYESEQILLKFLLEKFNEDATGTINNLDKIDFEEKLKKPFDLEKFSLKLDQIVNGELTLVNNETARTKPKYIFNDFEKAEFKEKLTEIASVKITSTNETQNVDKKKKLFSIIRTILIRIPKLQDLLLEQEKTPTFSENEMHYLELTNNFSNKFEELYTNLKREYLSEINSNLPLPQLFINNLTNLISEAKRTYALLLLKLPEEAIEIRTILENRKFKLEVLEEVFK